jgi:hypothetical protein
MNKFLLYSAGLIGLYLIVANAPGFQRILGTAGSVGSQYAKTLQGR